MPKVKVPRKSTAIDMTAMCDVAFLLLTFFILTATARQPEPLPVDTPASTVKIKLPETDVATITVGQGKIFFGVKGQQIRMNMLNRISEKYSLQFSEQEKLRFSLIESFGVPVGNLKQLIALSGDERNKPGVQPGIPADSTDNQLNEWILAARYATKELNGTDLRISIKGDSREEYPQIKKVIDILQEQNINKFSLITSLRQAEN
jgi:biopolymer transport protein ExbD